MSRSKILGGMALASMMLVVLTGCPGLIANVVSSSESVQQAVDQASAGDNIKVQGSHGEDVNVDKDNVTITGENGAEIKKVEVNADNVTIENVEITEDSIVDGNDVTLTNVTIQGALDTVPGSFENLTLDNVTVEAWGDATVNGTFTCDDILQPGDGTIQAFVDSASTGDNLCVAPDTYSESITIDKALSLSGLADPISSSTSAEVDGMFVVESDGVTLENFHILNGAGLNGGSEVKAIFVGDPSGFSDNPNQKIVLNSNLIEDVAGNPGFTTDTIQVKSFDGAPINGVEITNNVIRNISNSTADFGSGGRGAVGVKLQADVNNVTVDGNSVSNLTGLWNWGVSLTWSSGEPGLPNNVTITNNSFDGLSAAGGAVGVETGTSNDDAGELPVASGVTVTQNNFSNFGDPACGVINKDQDSTGEIVDAKNNWWDDSDGPGAVINGSTGAVVTDRSSNGVCVSEFVDFDPFANSAF